MNNKVIIEQLEKALNEKEMKPMKSRIEVLLGMLKDLSSPQTPPQPPQGVFNAQPIQQPISQPNGSPMACQIPQNANTGKHHPVQA